MYQIIIVIHVMLGLSIIGLIMMQQGKGADAGASFGSGSAGSVFGAQGAASFLSRTTAIMAALFFVTSLGLAFLNSKKGQTFDLMAPSSQEQPAVTETPPVDDKNNDKALEKLLLDQIKSQELPPKASGETAPAVSTNPVAPAEIKETTVPKAEAIKKVEENVLPSAAPKATDKKQ